jgi:two-component system KDP operon response regulator KdpE
VKALLSRRGYGVTLAATGEEALQRAAEVKPQLVILDLSLPGMSGFEVCRRLREWGSVPILVLSVKDEEADKVSALDFGADDYLTKPFLAGELLARVRALLRRAGNPESETSSMVQSGQLSIDLIERRVVMDGRALKLTRTEFAILGVLAVNAGRVVTTRSLLKSVWGAEADAADQVHALRVHLGHIRSKLEIDTESPRYIVTEPGVGYRLASLPTESQP